MRIYTPPHPEPTFSQIVDAFGGPTELAIMLHQKNPRRYKTDNPARIANWRKLGIPEFAWWELVGLPHARVMLFPGHGRTVKLTMPMLQKAAELHAAAQPGSTTKPMEQT
jgi:hypothetical protein